MNLIPTAISHTKKPDLCGVAPKAQRAGKSADLQACIASPHVGPSLARDANRAATYESGRTQEE